MKHILCIVFLALQVLGFSQTTVLISGTVSDENTRQPIPFVSVVMKGTNTSTSADEKGTFEIKCPAGETISLIFYNIGYQKKEIVVGPDKKMLTIFLSPKEYTLHEVDIVSKKVQTIQEESHTEFMDFDFYDDLIIALVNKGHSWNYLQIIDLEGKFITEKKAPANAEKIVKDCLGNIHLLSHDSTYQVYYNYVDIGYLPACSISVYRQILEPCQCRYGDLFYLKYKAYRKLKNIYYTVDIKHPKERILLATIADSSAINGFNQDYDLKYFLAQRKYGNYATSVDEIKKNIDLLREQLPLTNDYNLLLRPVSSTIFNFDKNIFLIDFTGRYVYTFLNSDSLIKKEKTDYLGDVQPEVIIDADTKSFYFKQEKNGITKLIRYNSTGIEKSLLIESYAFIKRIKVKSNYIYFLYKDPRDNSSRKIIKYCCSL